jgi:hypothetical protein
MMTQQGVGLFTVTRKDGTTNLKGIMGNKMKQHAFNQAEILVMKFCKRDQDVIWSEFISIMSDLDFTVRVTGGNFLTHEVNGSQEDFDTIIELLDEQQ